MGDPQNPKSSLSLPPGCRFYPSEEQIVCYYLAHKNAPNTPNDDHNLFGFDVIKEVNIYNYDPFDLPETTCFPYGYKGRKRHWYCYTSRVGKKREERRGAGSGFWKRKGKGRDLVGIEGHVVMGRKTSFVFYLGNSPKTAVRTNWFMDEYALIDNLKDIVLCRVFVKSHCGNNISDHRLGSCGEESILAVRHIGIQHDGTLVSDTHKDKTHDDKCIDKKKEFSYSPMGLDDLVKTGPLSDDLVKMAGFINATTPQQLITILEEEDYIELDDFIGPINGVD